MKKLTVKEAKQIVLEIEEKFRGEPLDSELKSFVLDDIKISIHNERWFLATSQNDITCCYHKNFKDQWELETSDG